MQKNLILIGFAFAVALTTLATGKLMSQAKYCRGKAK